MRLQFYGGGWLLIKKNCIAFATIRKIFIQSGSLKYAMKLLDKRITETLKILSQLKMRTTYKKIIEEAILQLFKHSKRMASQYDINQA